MKISSTPENYTGAFTDVIYTISDLLPEQIVEVTVLGENAADVLGIKRYRGQTEYNVNISNYIRRRMDAIPIAYTKSTFYTPEKRAAKASIKVGSLSSPQCTFIAGHQSGKQYSIMSDAPDIQTLAPGEIDEIPLLGAPNRPLFAYGFLTKGDDISEMVFSVGTLGDVMVLQINADEIVDQARHTILGNFFEYTHLEVSVEMNSLLTPVKKYEIKPKSDNTVRMCWVNPYGALDFYTFSQTDTQSIVADRKKAYTTDGYKCYGSYSEKFITVESGYENIDTIMWLSGIVCSPKVWIYSRGKFNEVDIVTNNVASGKNAPVSMKLTLRERLRKMHQSF